MKINNWKSIECGCLLEQERGTMEILLLSSSVARCRYHADGAVKDEAALEIDISSYQKTKYKIEDKNSFIHIYTDCLEIIVSKETSQISWYDVKTGKALLKEGTKEFNQKVVEQYVVKSGEEPVIETRITADGERSCIVNIEPKEMRMTYGARLPYFLDEDEKIYGFGQGEEGFYNYRGKTQYLYQHNMKIPMPIFLSSKQYGVFINTGSCLSFHDESEETYIDVDAVEQLEYYFMKGDNFDDIIAAYRTLVGRAVMLPKWAFGYIQSKERYKDQDEMVDIVKQYRELDIPIDAVVMDWHTWEEGLWGDKNLDTTRFYDMQDACDKIHEMNARVMISIWPNMNAGSQNHTELANAGYLLNDYSTYDAFDENARRMYWDQANRGLYSKGVDAWWCDCTEPFSSPDWGGEVRKSPEEKYQLVGGEHKRYIDAGQANMYALVHAQGVYENQLLENAEDRVLNLTRSGYAGSQKYGTVLWSGDISARWDVLEKQIAEGLSMCMSGIPYWTLDIGAFFTVKDKWENRGCGSSENTNPLWFWQGDYNDGVHDLGYRELYTRWIQFGSFLPMFRSHGTDTPREIWNFGKPGEMFYDSIEKFIKLRYQLMPYIYSLAGRVTQHHYTILRSLMFDYSNDANVSEISNEFMFGDYFLVCPIIKPLYYGIDSVELDAVKEWSCYLPTGNDWYDYWTNTRYSGGQWIVCDASIDKIPLFVKAGAILITEEALDYANETVDTPVHIYIYDGMDSTFMYYEDDGESHQYNKGGYNEIPFTWSDEEKTLTIGAGEKIMAQSIVGRRIMVHRGTVEKEVSYMGSSVTVKII